MLLLDLCDDVILYIMSYLSICDSRNLAHSCVRLYILNGMKYKHINLVRYAKSTNVKIPVDKMLECLGPHIVKLTATSYFFDSSTRRSIMTNCKNVKSLTIDRIPVPDSVWNEWIKELHLEYLSLENANSIHVLFDPVTTLKELQIKLRNISEDVWTFIERNSNIERLSIRLDRNFCYENFWKLQHLKCLQILHMDEIRDLTQLNKYLKMNQLRQLYLRIRCSRYAHVSALNIFLNSLAQSAMLQQLTLVGWVNFDQDTYCALQSFDNLVSLTIDCRFVFDDFIMMKPAPNLKYLKLRNNDSESTWSNTKKICLIVSNWDKLETLCYFVSTKVKRILTEKWIEDILKISTSKKAFRLLFDYTYAADPSDRCITGIELYFKSRTHRLIRANKNEIFDEENGLFSSLDTN